MSLHSSGTTPTPLSVTPCSSNATVRRHHLGLPAGPDHSPVWLPREEATSRVRASPRLFPRDSVNCQGQQSAKLSSLRGYWQLGGCHGHGIRGLQKGEAAEKQPNPEIYILGPALTGSAPRSLSRFHL